MDGYAAAEELRRLSDKGNLRNLEDGPFGGSAINVGGDIVGYAIEAPLPAAETWSVCRIADLSLAQSAWQLINHGRIWLPGMNQAHAVLLPIKAIADMIAWIGPYHADINWGGAGNKIRGPFVLKATNSAEAVTFPILWAHQADRERCIVFPADHEGVVKNSKDKRQAEEILEKVNSISASASNLHFNNNFRFNSQSTAMQFTKRRTIGGQAWISVRFHQPEMEAAVALWGNTSVGILSHWWQANKQQPGRGRIGKLALAKFFCLDPAGLSKEQIEASAKLLNELSDLSFRPINEIAADKNRAELDRKFLVDILGFPKAVAEDGGALSLLKAKLAAEPSINGGKKGNSAT